MKLHEIVKMPDIAKAHTYASENGDTYRIQDEGQSLYKNFIANIDIPTASESDVYSVIYDTICEEDDPIDYNNVAKALREKFIIIKRKDEKTGK